jgi:hypothetical protein
MKEMACFLRLPFIFSGRSKEMSLNGLLLLLEQDERLGDDLRQGN